MLTCMLKKHNQNFSCVLIKKKKGTCLSVLLSCLVKQIHPDNFVVLSFTETITALFKTNLRTEYPFDALELLAYSFIG